MQAMNVGDVIDGLEVISVYTRAQAIADGGLADVTALAGEAGFRHPTAITAGVMELCTPEARSSDDFKGRLWDVLQCAGAAMRRARDGSVARFQVRVGRRTHDLYVQCGPGDDMAPVLTILLSGED